MKKSVKILAIIITLILVLTALTGCGVENTTDSKKEEKELSRGQINGDVYTNDFAGITFKLPENWVYATDEEIAQIMNVGKEVMTDSQKKLSELAEKMGVYDMVANDPSTGASVMIMFEKPILKKTTEAYLDNLKVQLESVDTMKYEVSSDYTTETIAGVEYTVGTARVPEYNLVQKYYVRQEGKCFIDILVTYIEGMIDETSILANFQ